MFVAFGPFAFCLTSFDCVLSASESITQPLPCARRSLSGYSFNSALTASRLFAFRLQSSLLRWKILPHAERFIKIILPQRGKIFLEISPDGVIIGCVSEAGLIKVSSYEERERQYAYGFRGCSEAWRERTQIRNWAKQGIFPGAELKESPRGPYWEIPETDLKRSRSQRAGDLQGKKMRSRRFSKRLTDNRHSPLTGALPIDYSLRCSCTRRYLIFTGMGRIVSDAETRAREQAASIKATFIDARSTPFMQCECGQVLDFMPDDSLIVM